MGGDKQTTQSSQNQQIQYTATPEERQLEQMQLQRLQGNQGNQQQMDTNSFNLVNSLLTGGNLPGNLQGAMGINENQTQSMVNQSLKDIYPQFQQAGILDSGTAAQIASRTAADVRNSNTQFNVQALQQLLNQAIGGSSNLSQSTTSQNSVLGSQLSGLRSINQSGSYSGSTIGMNPFLKSFQQSAGKTLGNPQFSMGQNDWLGFGGA